MQTNCKEALHEIGFSTDLLCQHSVEELMSDGISVHSAFRHNIYTLSGDGARSLSRSSHQFVHATVTQSLVQLFTETKKNTQKTNFHKETQKNIKSKATI